jgi:hypothetical protein
MLVAWLQHQWPRTSLSTSVTVSMLVLSPLIMLCFSACLLSTLARIVHLLRYGLRLSIGQCGVAPLATSTPLPDAAAPAAPAPAACWAGALPLVAFSFCAAGAFEREGLAPVKSVGDVAMGVSRAEPGVGNEKAAAAGGAGVSGILHAMSCARGGVSFPRI